PQSHNGALGADLAELEEEASKDVDVKAVIAELDAEETRFGERVKAALATVGMTQQELANAIGVGQPAVSMLLNRECRPQRRTVEKIANALNVPFAELWPE
ncbi:MAG: helix-turn-helix transcriptional regulator, partial [Planctomycetaceae bacterium]|nr:helix-turn-helix transcriptional regulator [Planctomycetaceae bacterium]